jgi:hypothetical protein
LILSLEDLPQTAQREDLKQAAAQELESAAFACRLSRLYCGGNGSSWINLFLICCCAHPCLSAAAVADYFS